MSLEKVIGDLESARDRLTDLIYDELRRAVAAGESGRPPLERRLTRARSAVERAIAQLSRADPLADGDED